MIKKIPIKGISRDPSGQISSDGFCAESLNVQLDMGEVAPAMKPRKVKDAGGNPVSVGGDILYIHKGIGYENLIYQDGRNILYTATVGESASGSVYGGLEPSEYVKDVAAVGNTVIIATDKDMYYILWRDGAYHFLGNQIPVPAIHFRMGNMETMRVEPNVDLSIDWSDPDMTSVDSAAQYQVGDIDGFPAFPHETIGDVTKYGPAAKKYVFDQNYDFGFWSGVLDSIWGEIDEKVNEQARLGKAVFPIFVRYAVRLYDGTVYSQSIPVLLGADIDKFVDVKAIVAQEFAGQSMESPFITFAVSALGFARGYSVMMNADGQRNVFDGWEDIVSSVDVFVSSQLAPIQRNAAKFTMEYKYLLHETTLNLTAYLIDNFVLDPYYTVDNQDKLVLNYQDTYLAKSFTIDEFKALSGDTDLELDLSADHILAQEAMAETPWSMHHTVGGRLFTYNKRLMLAEAEQSLSHGYQFLHSVAWKTPGADTNSRFRFVYYIRGENGENVVICRDANGSALISRKTARVVSESGTEYIEVPYSWLAYPDARCYQIDVYEVDGANIKKASFKTSVFDRADVAYVFLGFAKQITPSVSVNELPSEENTTYLMPNTLVVSKANNPLVFPAEDSVTFSAGEVMNIAVASVPLSEGQAGQFPLYVFTDEGVFAMTVDAEGRLRTSHNVSRDILISKDAVVGIEQGVFFAAARGLLLLQGSRVTKVSSEMDGLPDALDGDLLRQVETRFLGMQVEDPRAFRSFLFGCFLAYDYANSRILVLNPACASQYAYKFDTQSWHRLQTGDGTPMRALNSFPEAQVVMKSGNNQSVLDFSVLAENEDAVPLKGLVYTRDLDLDGADIYKTISRLKVRGRYADGHVKWQLQGSNDGVRYKTVHSLWGPSWKWYRIALVTMLGKDERISYVELDYAPRFTDKIR